jgi:hypothetical protein
MIRTVESWRSKVPDIIGYLVLEAIIRPTDTVELRHEYHETAAKDATTAVSTGIIQIFLTFAALDSIAGLQVPPIGYGFIIVVTGGFWRYLSQMGDEWKRDDERYRLRTRGELAAVPLPTAPDGGTVVGRTIRKTAGAAVGIGSLVTYLPLVRGLLPSHTLTDIGPSIGLPLVQGVTLVDIAPALCLLLFVSVDDIILLLRVVLEASAVLVVFFCLTMSLRAISPEFAAITWVVGMLCIATTALLHGIYHIYNLVVIFHRETNQPQ